MFIAWATCSCIVLQLQSAEVSRTVTSSFEWSWTISVNVNEGTPRSRESNSIQFICVTIICCLRTINSSTLDVGTIASVRGLPELPSLNLRFELRPSQNNARDTFPTGTAQDTTRRSIKTTYITISTATCLGLINGWDGPMQKIQKSFHVATLKCSKRSQIPQLIHSQI